MLGGLEFRTITAAVRRALAGLSGDGSGAQLVGFTQAGIGAIPTTVSDELRLLCVTPQQFGALGNGVHDDTDAWNRCKVAAASSGKAFFIPAGDYLITDETAAIAGQITMFGAGPYKSRIIFRPTANNKAALKLSNGASRCERVVMHDFAIYSDDTTYTKIALDVYDLSVCSIERVLIYGTGGAGPSAGACWSGNANTSIGLRTHGREATGLSDIEIVADIPIYVAANPNTVANDGEDLDHWNFHNCYLLGNGNPIIYVADGLGVNEIEFGGYQAWVGGTAGFRINDTRAAPTVPSRGLSFKNVRHEQITDAAGYSFNMTFTLPIQNIGFEKVLMGGIGHGITINGFERMVCDRVTAAMGAGKNSLVTAGAQSNSVLAMKGCIWQPGANVTLTGLTQITAEAYRSASYAAPSDAVYAGQITDTRVNVEKVTATCANTAVGLLVTGLTGDALQILPQAAASGVTLRGVNNGQTDFTPINYVFSQMNFAYRTGAATSATAAIINSAGLQMSLRSQEKQGANLTAANNLTLGSDGNYFQVDGNTQINLILNTNWQGGAKVTLKFNGTPTVKHNQGASGNNKPILLVGAADFVATANDTLTLRYDATDAVWYENSRAVI